VTSFAVTASDYTEAGGIERAPASITSTPRGLTAGSREFSAGSARWRSLDPTYILRLAF